MCPRSTKGNVMPADEIASRGPRRHLACSSRFGVHPSLAFPFTSLRYAVGNNCFRRIVCNAIVPSRIDEERDFSLSTSRAGISLCGLHCGERRTRTRGCILMYTSCRSHRRCTNFFSFYAETVTHRENISRIFFSLSLFVKISFSV